MEPLQRWLSLDGICTTLNINRAHALWLAKQGYLEYIPGPGNKKTAQARFLDPTPAYADRLRMGEALYGRQMLPSNLEFTALLTMREMAEVLGWDFRRMQRFVYKNKVPHIKAGHYSLYSVAALRDIMWRRNGRKLAKQRAPFLISEIIDFFHSMRLRSEEEVPTDAQFAADDLLQRKLARMMQMPSPQRELAMKEFQDKVALAKLVAPSSQG
jgi:hypothetical protein